MQNINQNLSKVKSFLNASSTSTPEPCSIAGRRYQPAARGGNDSSVPLIPNSLPINHVFEVISEIDSQIALFDTEKALKTPHYLEQYTRSDNSHFFSSYYCKPNFIYSKCLSGHHFYRSVYCGKEYCGRCGKQGSPHHLRRIARAWDRIINQTDSLGFLVVTIPPQVGDISYSPKFLKDVRRYVWRWLKRSGITQRGMCRFHMEGSKSSKYFPHWNFLFAAKWINKKLLTDFRLDYTKWLKNRCPILNIDSADIKYEYRSTLREKVHTLKYVTRPTYHHRSREKDAVSKSFLGTSWFGKWPSKKSRSHSMESLDPADQRMVKENKYLDSLEKKICPICGKKVTHFFRKRKDVQLDNLIEMVPGRLYVQYIIPSTRGP